MMEQAKIHKALGGIRGRPSVDLPALEQLLVRFSQLVVEQRCLKEIDINPMVASPERLIAVDGRVVLHDAHVSLDDLPRLAIGPYPRKYESDRTAADGTAFRLRPIRPEDGPPRRRVPPLAVRRDGRSALPSRARPHQRTAHDRLIRICFTDYDRELPLVAEHVTADGRRAIAGIGRLRKDVTTPTAEFAVLVADLWQGRGLGTGLLRRIVAVAHAESSSGSAPTSPRRTGG